MKTIAHQKIIPFLWFNDQAEEAIKFYTSSFKNSEISTLKKWPEESPFPSDKIQTGSFLLEGLQFYAFDAGPQFTFNSAISFFVICDTEGEVEELWNKFIDGGKVMMALDTYPWSQKYGWLEDKYGIGWQFMLADGSAETTQKIVPLFMFSGENRGKAQEAIELYTSLFNDSGVDMIAKYEEGEPGPTGMIKHASFKLEGIEFRIMDSGVDNKVPFNEAISLFVKCENQTEVDHFWNKLTAEGNESRCGWLKDMFGVSWQIVPDFLMNKMMHGEPAKTKKMTAAMMQMSKLEVGELEKAYNS